MAIIRASCGDCGELELTVADVSVRTCSADQKSTYSFRCPHCEMTMVKPLADRTVDMLVSAGVVATLWHLPSEIAERPNGPRINHDDLLDFHRVINDPLWFSSLADAIERPVTPLTPHDQDRPIAVSYTHLTLPTKA